MRILITGSAGFVGTHLVTELLRADPGERSKHSVISVDREQAHLDEEGAAERVISEWEPDYVVHLAARYGRLLCRDEPHLAVQDNTASTTELAAACAERGIPVLYASSSEVYGDHGTDLITEESELRMPTTIYGLSKRWGEEVLKLYTFPGILCVVRMNMLYGPEQLGGYGRCALATFIQNAVEGKPNTIHSDASRSWLYISDAVRALRLLIEGHRYGVFNLGNEGEPKSMLELARMVEAEVGSVGETGELVKAPSGQIRHKNYSSEKLRKTIGWEPEVNLEEGIRRTAQWARKEAECLERNTA